MNTMIRFYSDSVNAAQKQAMAFELSEYDLKTIKFGKLFKERFMSLDAAMPLEAALESVLGNHGRMLQSGRNPDEAEPH